MKCLEEVMAKKKSAGGKRKLSGAAKAAFLARMAKGRRKARRNPDGGHAIVLHAPKAKRKSSHALTPSVAKRAQLKRARTVLAKKLGIAVSGHVAAGKRAWAKKSPAAKAAAKKILAAGRAKLRAKRGRGPGRVARKR